MLSDFQSPTWFLIWSFLAQMIGGCGSGINAVASMAMVVSSSKASEREQNIGLIEMATGVGFLFGPIWGSFMFQLGGYSAPFGSAGKFNNLNPCLNIFYSFLQRFSMSLPTPSALPFFGGHAVAVSQRSRP